MNFLDEFNKYKDEIIKHTIELVSIPSVLVENEEVDGKVYPFGYNNKLALDYVLNLGKSLGFVTKNVEDVCGHIEYGDGEEIFAVLCHLDVVPAEGSWTNPPFSPWVVDDKIYGRGTIDDKGPLICSLYALKTIKDLNIKLKRKIRLIIGTDEETDSRGLKRYLEVEKVPEMGISPDADFPLIYGEKGICSIKFSCVNNSEITAKGGVRYNVVAPQVSFETNMDINDDFNKLDDVSIEDGVYNIYGKSAHAMEPDNGINAIKRFALFMKDKTDDNMIKFINECLLDTRLKDIGLNVTDDEMGDLTMNMGVLSYDDKATLGVNIRYPRKLVFEEFITKIKEIAFKYSIDVEVISNTVPHYVDPSSDFIKTLYSSYSKYTSDRSPMKTLGGGTYAREIKKAVAFGVNFPGDIEMAHEVDEFISIDKLMLAGAIIIDAICSLNNIDK